MTDYRWEVARSLLRRGELLRQVEQCKDGWTSLVGGSDATLHDGSYNGAGGHSRVGVDTEANARLWSLRMGIRLIATQDREAALLLVRDIGRPCRGGHRAPAGHCHPIPKHEIPQLQSLSWEELEKRTAKAADWLLSVAS